MYKQNRDLMTTQTKQTPSDQEMDDMIHRLAYDYKEAHGNGLEYQALKQLLNDLLMFGEGEGVLVKTAIKQLWQANEDQKEGV